MKSSRKNVARVGAVAGVAALALLANPALGSAKVAGSATVTGSGPRAVVEFTGISSPTLAGCNVALVQLGGVLVAGGPVAITGDPGTGSWTSPELGAGRYTVSTFCVDADGVTVMTAPGTEFSVAAALEDLPGSAAGSAVGSLGQLLGS